MHCENSDFSWCYENTEQRREESMVHNSVTQGMNTIYIIGLAPVICACSPVTGSWKRAGNSVFELLSTKRKLCRQRPTTWTTKASKMQQHDWISIRRILYISCVCEHVTRRTCCVCTLSNERLPRAWRSIVFTVSIVFDRVTFTGRSIATKIFLASCLSPFDSIIVFFLWGLIPCCMRSPRMMGKRVTEF